MKKYVLICLIVFIVIGGVASMLYLIKSVSKVEVHGTLFINEKVITDKYVIIHQKYAEIPLIEVLQNSGFDIVWVDNTTAEAIYQGEKYIIDLKEKSFLREGKNDNLITPTPGGNTFSCKIVESNIILDSNTVKSIMFRIGRNLSVIVDYSKSEVYINIY